MAGAAADRGGIRVQSLTVPAGIVETLAGALDDQLTMLQHIVDPTARLLAHMQLTSLPLTFLINALPSAAGFEPIDPQSQDAAQQRAYEHAKRDYDRASARLQATADRMRKSNLEMIDIMQQRCFAPDHPVGRAMRKAAKTEFKHSDATLAATRPTTATPPASLAKTSPVCTTTAPLLPTMNTLEPVYRTITYVRHPETGAWQEVRSDVPPTEITLPHTTIVKPADAHMPNAAAAGNVQNQNATVLPLDHDDVYD